MTKNEYFEAIVQDFQRVEKASHSDTHKTRIMLAVCAANICASLEAVALVVRDSSGTPRHDLRSTFAQFFGGPRP